MPENVDEAVEVVAIALDEAISDFVYARVAGGYDANPQVAARVAVHALQAAGLLSRRPPSPGTLMAAWRRIEQLVGGAPGSTTESTIERVRELAEHESTAAIPGIVDAEVLETAAQILHSRRHRLGWGSVCGRCRGDAAAALAVQRG